MLESNEHGKDIQNTFEVGIRESRIGFWRSFFTSIKNFLPRLQILGTDGFSSGLDEKLSTTIRKSDYMNQYMPNASDGENHSQKEQLLDHNTLDYGFVGVGNGNAQSSNFAQNNPLLHGLQFEDGTDDIPILPSNRANSDELILVPTKVEAIHGLKVEKPKDPVFSMLEKAKTELTTVDLTFSLELPKQEILLMFAQNFPESKEAIAAFIAEKLNEHLINEIKTQFLKLDTSDEELSDID